MPLFDATIRSNLIYGYVDADNPGFLSGDTYDNTHYIVADLIWNPYKTVTLGVEYLRGHGSQINTNVSNKKKGDRK